MVYKANYDKCDYKDIEICIFVLPFGNKSYTLVKEIFIYFIISNLHMYVCLFSAICHMQAYITYFNFMLIHRIDMLH